MSARNEFRVTARGDVDDLTRAMDRVGSGARDMGNDVEKSSTRIAGAFESVGGHADNVASKGAQAAGGLSGLGDLVGGQFGAAMVSGGVAMQAFADAGDLVNVIAESSIVLKAKDVIATGAKKAADLASAAASKVAAASQWALNAAMSANPIGLVVIAIVALVAVFVLAYKKSDTFRRIVNAAFDGIKKTAQAVASFFTDKIPAAFRRVSDAAGDVLGWVKGHWPLILGIITGPIGLAVLMIGKNKDRILGLFQKIPGGIRAAFKGLAGFITAPFTAALSAIKNLLNSTVGGFGFTVPDWIPKIGGQSFTIPSMHTGGVMPGAPGTAGLALLMAGERVTPVGGRGGGSTVIEIRSDGSKLGDLLLEVLRNAIRVKNGGDVQLALGRGR